ncbi:CYTH and CHAD domain-containing protein [Azospira restricta]|uniref:CYTH and CHAD domain-containing protein n=1 Tax=Azospira restricta TaxID=404405 RepID=A0A974PX02_9RHOO|nr:CYTH and CHAD domain-containing protein [Azospira restricta]QRJ62851.1 CYTH and CHAD domain-containing protein [Azospira restricta]
MAVETELKLALPAAAAARLRRHPLLAATPPVRQRLHNCYYDTADLDLWRAGIALRHRRTARGWLLTVKSAEPAAGGLARRSEWEAASKPDAFDFSHVDDKRLRRRLEALTPALQPAFVTDFVRDTWLLAPAPGVEIELALDRGSIRHGERAEAICEVELELLAGPISALFDLARALQAGLPLSPAAASKAERGYRLFRNEVAQPVHAGLSPLDARMTPLAAFRALAFDCVEQLLRNMDGAGAGDDPEFLHQARVAVRRLRSAMRLWRPFLPADFRALFEPAWQWFGQTLGEARNRDVFITQTLPSLSAGCPGHPSLATLAARAERQRRRSRRALRTALAAPLAGRLVLEFSAALHALAEPAATPTLAAFAAARVRRLSRRVARLAAAAGRDPAALHRLRIATKHLRYALEFFAPLFRRRRQRRLLAAAAKVQALLGELNDLHVAEALLAECRLPADAQLAAWFAGRAALLHARLPDALSGLVRAPLPRRRRRRR